MIHFCDVVATPRRVTSIPVVPSTAGRANRAWLGLVSLLALLLSLAVSLGAQPPAVPRDTARAVPRRQISWTSDRRTFAVGDIIKVVIDEEVSAEASKDNASSASRSRKMGLGISPPKMGVAPMADIEGSVGSNDGGASHNRGKAANGTSYVGDIPVRVIAITPEGLLQVKGTKTIDVDKNKQVMLLTGFIRPMDVNARDFVASSSIADAELSYQSKGGLGKPKSGIVTKIIGIFWP
jgi:flagellar L-ring protein FlgH